jgi:hypothetical protein
VIANPDLPPTTLSIPEQPKIHARFEATSRPSRIARELASGWLGCRPLGPAWGTLHLGGIRSNFCNDASMVSQAGPRTVYVAICGLNWLESSRLPAWTAIRSGIATNVR